MEDAFGLLSNSGQYSKQSKIMLQMTENDARRWFDTAL